MTVSENTNIENYGQFQDKIISFINALNQLNFSQNIVSESLKVLESFSNSSSCAFFRMNPENFDFSLNKANPDSTKHFYESVLEDLSESGNIGIAFQSGKFSVYYNERINIWHLLLPVISTKNVIGFFVLTSENDFSSTEIQLMNLLIIFSRAFGMAIENKEIYSKQSKTNELVDQLIASRTLELVENNQALGEKIESLKSNLSMSIPHEVRTPINEILGLVNYLNNFLFNYNTIKEQDRTDILDILKDIKFSANRLKNLFENFIYHTRLSIISTSIKEIEHIQSQISPFCESIIFEQAQIKAQSYDRVDDLEVNLVSSTLRIGEEYLTKLIDELVDNALKYSDTGEKVAIYSSIENDMYSLTISDNGSGIPAEFLNQIDAYIQFNRQKNEQQGLGLGLAIVYKIVDLHNGIINIESEEKKFTKISIKLQIANGFSYD